MGISFFIKLVKFMTSFYKNVDVIAKLIQRNKCRYGTIVKSRDFQFGIPYIPNRQLPVQNQQEKP